MMLRKPAFRIFPETLLLYNVNYLVCSTGFVVQRDILQLLASSRSIQPLLSAPQLQDNNGTTATSSVPLQHGSSRLCSSRFALCCEDENLFQFLDLCLFQLLRVFDLGHLSQIGRQLERSNPPTRSKLIRSAEESENKETLSNEF